jgi:hypothetical protein
MIFEEYKKIDGTKKYNISQAITFIFKQLRKIYTNQRSMKQSDYNFYNKII